MADKSLEDMVKAVSANPAYKVLTKEEYDLLVSLKEGASAKNKDVDQTGKKVPSNEAGSPEKCKEQGNGINTSTPDNKHVYFDGYIYISFYISAQNIDCGYSFEPPRRGGSNEYPQSMFWAEI